MPAPTYVATTLGNDGTTAVGDTSFNMAVPGLATAGMVAVITAVQNTGVNTFSLSGGAGGWTTWSGPDDLTTNLRTYVWAKVLAAGDIGATITVSATGGGRFIGRMDVFQDVDFASCSDIFSEDSTADTSISAPGISIGSTNFLIYTIYHLRTAAASSTTITSHIASHTARGGICNTVVASPNYSIEATTFIPPSTGTQGGGTATAGASSTDRVYSIALAGTTASTQNLDPTAVASAAALGSPSISTTVTASPTAVSTGASLGTPDITTTITSSPTAIATAAALGAPALAMTIALAPDAVASEAVLGEPTITMGTGQVAPESIPSSESLGEPSVSIPWNVEPESIVSAEVIPDPELYNNITIEVGDIASGESMGSPTALQQVLYRVFRTPYVIHNHRIEGALVASLHYGISVFRIGGVWDSAEYPSAEQEAAADLFYRGGHVYDLSDEEVTALEAEGYTIDTEFRDA